MRRIALMAILCGTLALGVAAADGKKKPTSVFVAAPSFPNSTLFINVNGRPRAGGIVRLMVSGSNEPNEYSPGLYTPYDLDVFVQNGKVLRNCPRSFDEELNNDINLLAVSRVMMGANEGDFGSFNIPVTFQSNPKVRTVVACAYSRSIIDDVAVSAIGFKLPKPRKRGR